MRDTTVTYVSKAGPHGKHIDVLVHRQRVKNFRSETLVEESCSRSQTPSCAVKLESASKIRPSRESQEQNDDDDFRKAT